MDRVIYGENCVYSTDCNQTGLNNNGMIAAASGAGKTLSFTEANLLEYVRSCTRSLICTVTKRRIIDKYTPLLTQRGYDVQILDCVHPDRGTVGYDPLRHISSYQDITFLAESIVKADQKREQSNADPYWDNAADSLLSAEIGFTLMTKKNATFSDVLNMHDHLEFEERGSQIFTSYDRKFEYVAKNAPDCFAVSCWKSFRQLPIKTASCVFGTLNTVIDKIFTPDLREMMAMERQVDFEKLGSRKTVLFVCTSPVNPALHCFVNLFYAQMFKELFEFAEERPDGMLPVPVHVIADDFATGCKVPNFAEYISIFREKRISVTLLIQSESQLESIYGYHDAVTIINNCDTYVYMGGMDVKTAQNISLRLNAPLDEVLYMPVGQEIVFRRGQRPVVTQRYNILADPMYQEVTRQFEQRIKGQVR
ncbi:MAG: type IV secretory system conjugative DNA transfer family protein [Clostridiales bacterium]|nr:type IV secretory system conjugative DNA transfer family protein [Clostridiales bacterium]